MRGTWLGAIICLSAACGCGDGIIPIQTAPVSGTVTFNGEPLEDYRVYFYVPGDAEEPASGRAAADGSFTLSVREKGDGAIVGLNQVYIAWDPELEEPEPGREEAIVVPPQPFEIPDKYFNRDESGLTVDVPPEGLTDYKLELE